jgi:hypothetical protein
VSVIATKRAPLNVRQDSLRITPENKTNAGPYCNKIHGNSRVDYGISGKFFMITAQ